MTPTPRSPQQRDRRFARVRRLSQVLLLGSVTVSGLAVMYLAGTTKPLTNTALGVQPSSAVPAPTSGDNGSLNAGDDGSSTPTSPSTAPPTSGTATPSTAPVTTTTTCYSTPSGHVTCI